jgi:hypothetical protein
MFGTPFSVFYLVAFTLLMKAIINKVWVEKVNNQSDIIIALAFN